MRKCNIFDDRKKSMNFTATIFTKIMTKIITDISYRTSPKLNNKCDKCVYLTLVSKVASTQPIFMKPHEN
jgi:hypothetical protein